MAYLIGLDCGGTHIVGQVWSTATTPTLVNEVTGGPGNVVLDATAAVQNMTTVLDQLIQALAPQTPTLILLGVAGIETTGGAPALQAQLSQHYQLPVHVISDAKLALLNGLAGNDGTLVIAGTGSVVYGRQAGQFLRAGGWGYLLGDTGSAYDIVKAALQLVLAAHDQGKVDPLTPTLLTALHADTLTTAVNHFYAQDRQTNAQLARIIATAAKHGNGTAQQVLTTTATALADQVLTLYRRFQAPRPRQIALSGSVLQHTPLVQQTLCAHIQAAVAEIEFTTINTNNAHAVVYWQRWAQSGDVQT